LTSNSETTSGLKNETRARSVITRVNRYHVPLFIVEPIWRTKSSTTRMNMFGARFTLKG
jgi:hypothetical protein